MGMRYGLLLILLTACTPQEEVAPLPSSIRGDMYSTTDTIDAAADMTRSQAAPANGAPLSSACTASQQCIGDYGQGRCLIDVSGTGHCTAAIYFMSTNSMNYCRSTNPSVCCLSANVNGMQGSEVTGVIADWFTGMPTGGACDFGAFAPWVP